MYKRQLIEHAQVDVLRLHARLARLGHAKAHLVARAQAHSGLARRPAVDEGLPLFNEGGHARARQFRARRYVSVQARAGVAILRAPAEGISHGAFLLSLIHISTMLWASSYLALGRGVSAEAAAGYASLFFIGITVGRALNGFLTMRFSDAQMIRAGQALSLIHI